MQQSKWLHLSVCLSLSLSAAFTELQTDLADLVQISDDKNLPYRDFRSFAMRFLFPSAGADHPVLNPLPVADSQEMVPHLKAFHQLILDKKFLLLFVRTLEAQQGRFTLQDKLVYLSCLSACLSVCLPACFSPFSSLFSWPQGLLHVDFFALPPSLVLVHKAGRLSYYTSGLIWGTLVKKTYACIVCVYNRIALFT